MPLSIDYICPRCKYSTNLKSRIKRHFYSLKNPCANETGVELTDEIRDCVLVNHKYVPSKQSNTPVNNINVYNVFNNLIAQLDVEQKLGLLMDFQNKKILDFGDHLESEFSFQLKRLENNDYPNGHFLGHDDLLKLVDNVTKIDKENLYRFNILFDRTVRQIKLYSYGDWESFLEEIGCIEVINLIKSYFLDMYEMYLIRNLHCDNGNQNRVKLREYLEIYYSFISVFELSPSICNQTDKEILGHDVLEDNEYYLSDRYTNMFREKRRELKPTDKNRIKRRIACIIKENTQHNLSQLNKVILDLLKIDNSFKQEVLKLTEGFD